MQLAADWQQRLCASLEELASLEGADAVACGRLREKLSAGVFTLVVVGQFKRGKSSLINALLGHNLMPVGVVPLTSIVTVLRYGSAPAAHVEFQSGEARDISLREVVEYATEKANPGNTKDVRRVVVDYPSDWLLGGVRIVDTPGIGSVYQHNTDSTYAYLPEADAVLFVTSTDQPVSRGELDFLGEIRHQAGKIFCLLNKSDYLGADELKEALEFSAQALQQATGQPLPVHPVSARQALAAKLAGDAIGLERSGFPAFETTLRRFFGEEKTAVWRHSLTHDLVRLIVDARLKLHAERQALLLPLERSRAVLEFLGEKHAQMLSRADEYEVLLAHAVDRLYAAEIEPELRRFKEDLKRALPVEVEAWYADSRQNHGKDLERELEARTIARVRSAYDTWRATQDREWNLRFEKICLEYWSRIQAEIDELLRHASELLSIPYQAVNAGLLWQANTDFYYKFWEIFPSLQLIRAFLIHRLPRFLRDPLILNHARQRAVELAETQAGRIRYDFDARLRENLKNFKSLIHARIEATLGAMQAAIRKGAELNHSNQPAIEARRLALDDHEKRLTALQARLEGVHVPPAELSAAGAR